MEKSQIKQVFKKWLEIKAKEEPIFYLAKATDRDWVYNQLQCDIDHSSLLDRLLDGKDPLPKPPPLRFGYPDYELAEGKKVRVYEICQLPESDIWIIDQCGEWKNLGKDIFEYKDGTRYQLTYEDDKKYLQRII